MTTGGSDQWYRTTHYWKTPISFARSSPNFTLLHPLLHVCFSIYYSLYYKFLTLLQVGLSINFHLFSINFHFLGLSINFHLLCVPQHQLSSVHSTHTTDESWCWGRGNRSRWSLYYIINHFTAPQTSLTLLRVYYINWLYYRWKMMQRPTKLKPPNYADL